jgi:hypothetical protein
MRLSGLRQTTYQAKHHVSKGLTRMKSALEREREWYQAKEKAGLCANQERRRA